jgi:hypothetical protein
LGFAYIVRYVRGLLQVLGALALLAVVGLGVFVVHALYLQREETTPASSREVVFVLNWGGINPNQSYSVVSTYKSLVSMHGDHLEVHCIQLVSFEVDAMQREGWRVGPDPNPLIAKVLSQAATLGQSEKCFSKNASSDLSGVGSFVWGVHLRGRDHIEGAQVLLYEPATRRLLYVSHET